MKFSNEDKIILNYFFTSSNEKDTVYAAKQTLPSTVIGYLIGRASRAKETFREIFLNEIHNLPNRTFENITASFLNLGMGTNVYIYDLKDPVVDELNEKSIDFLNKWKMHNSLRDIPHFAIFCDDLSILQTKIWEYEPVAEYQEKSTRYRPFIATNVFLPECNDKDKLNELIEAQGELINVYNEIYDLTGNRDLARYLLPVGSRTAMGCFASIRSWERIVARMFDYPTRESKELGLDITKHLRLAISKNTIGFNPLTNSDVDFNFLNSIPNYNFMESEQKVEITKMKNQDVYFIDGLIDIGAHRDLQRHRSVIQNFPDYRAFYGYDKYISEFIEKSLYDKYSEMMKRFSKLHLDFYELLKDTKNIGESQFVSLLGHMTKFSYITDKNRWNYIHNLRTGSPLQQATNPQTVHFSYSHWCKITQSKMNTLDS